MRVRFWRRLPIEVDTSADVAYFADDRPARTRCYDCDWSEDLPMGEARRATLTHTMVAGHVTRADVL